MIARIKRTDAIQRVGMAILALSITIAVVGVLDQYGNLDLAHALEHMFRDFYANLSTELGSIAVTILVLDALYRRRDQLIEEQRDKDRLVRQMGNRDNTLALRAVEELRVHGWLEDGTLEGVHIVWANLQNADLDKADLHSADLWLTNMQQARLYKANLQGTLMQAVDLGEANLDGANLASANLNESNLLNARLSERTLFTRDTVLPDCTFWTPGVDLRRFTNPLHPDFWRSKNRRSPAYQRNGEDD